MIDLDDIPDLTPEAHRARELARIAGIVACTGGQLPESLSEASSDRRAGESPGDADEPCSDADGIARSDVLTIDGASITTFPTRPPTETAMPDEAAKRRNCKKVPVVCVETGKTFESASAAERANNLSPGAVSQILAGKGKTAKGLTFRRANVPAPAASGPPATPEAPPPPPKTHERDSVPARAAAGPKDMSRCRARILFVEITADDATVASALQSVIDTFFKQ
ncbi:MAG TPA: hypothetical protein VF624_15815 [Tepidisphaeraceae bacterium]